MADLLTRLDLHEVGRRYVLARAKRINPDRVDTEGSDANLFVGSMAFVGHAIVRQLADRVGALLLDGANGEDLDRYAFDRYQEQRKGASPAKVPLVFSRPTTNAGSGSIPVGTVCVSLGGIEYVTTSQADFGAGDLGPVTADARAVQAGKAYQVGANQIRRFKNIGLLWDSTLQVNNDEKAAGGENAEEDGVFRERVRGFWNSARRGTLSAIALGARSVPGVVSALAVEALDGSARPARIVNLYIADSSGIASAVLGREVDTQLLDYRAAGIAVVSTLSFPQLIQMSFKLVFAAGVNTKVLTENVRSAAFEFVNSLPVNGSLLRLALGAVLQRFKNDGLIVSEDSIIEPAGDLVPAPGRSLRVQLSDISFV